MANYTTGAQRHNTRQDKIWEAYKRNEAARQPKPTNLNPLFIDQISDFAHLVTSNNQTKAEFLESIKTYCCNNPKTNLFYQACERSDFETIRLNDTRDSILFNQ